MLRPASVLRRHTCGCSWLDGIPTRSCTLYVTFAKIAIATDVTWEGHYSANITDEYGPTRFSVTAFSGSGESEKPVRWDDVLALSVVGLLDFSIPALNYSLSRCSNVVCYTRHPPTEHHKLVFWKAPVLMFTCSRLLCRLGWRTSSTRAAVISPRLRIWWRRLSVRYDFPWLRTTENFFSKVH